MYFVCGLAFDYVWTFFLFSVNNCLQSLIGLLTKTDDVDLQIQAAWCLTNIATGRPEHSLAVAKAAAPYFITYVSGSSPLLQVSLYVCRCLKFYADVFVMPALFVIFLP